MHEAKLLLVKSRQMHNTEEKAPESLKWAENPGLHGDQLFLVTE